MTTLQEVLADKSTRSKLVADCVVVIDEEVKSKSGLSGGVIKGAYRLVKGVKPGFVPDAVESLIDDFAEKLQPFADEANEKGVDVSTFFKDNAPRIANELLSITDARAQRSSHKSVRKTYEKLRPKAQTHVAAACPRIGVLVEKYTSD